MSEIADLTYNVVAFTEIMQMVWKRLNDHGKNWRHVYKALVLLDYIIKTGSEKVAQQCKENIFAIQTLKDFQYIEEGKDHGMNVREKAKQLVNLLKDDERLKNERAKAIKAKERFAQNTMGLSGTPSGAGEGSRYGGSSPNLHSSTSGEFGDRYGGGYTDASTPAHNPQELSTAQPAAIPSNSELEAARPSTVGEEELQLQLALAMSKEEHDEDAKRMKSDQIKLQLAIEESRKETTDMPPSYSAGGGGGGTLLDLAAGGAAAPAADPWGGEPQMPPADPWGEQPRSKPAADPWGAQPPALAPAPQPASNDPWSAPSASNPAQASDPWGAPAPAPAPANANASPWTSQNTNGAHPPKNGGLDDEFDLIGTRSKSPQNAGSDQGLDPWDLGGMNDALSPMKSGIVTNEPPKSKSPASFLGEHANLVNMDELVSRPPANSTNPFAMTQPTVQQAPNPFAGQQQPQRVPLNQMQTSQSMGFTPSQQSGGILPTPLVPVNPGQNQASNPFL